MSDGHVFRLYLYNQLMKAKLRVLFTALGVILFWRGVWLAADICIFPHDPIWSIVTCIVCGLLILYFMKYENF